MLRLPWWTITVFILSIIVFALLLGQRQIRQTNAAGCLANSGDGTYTFYGDAACLIASGDSTIYVYGNVTKVSFIAAGNTTIYIYGNVNQIEFTASGNTSITVYGDISGSISGIYSGTATARACTITGSVGGIPLVDAVVDPGLCPTPTPTLTPTPTGAYTIQGNVYVDANSNQVKDGGDTNYGAGTTVTLSGSESRSTITDGSGNYVFSGLYNGTYTVILTLPPGYQNTTPLLQDVIFP